MDTIPLYERLGTKRVKNAQASNVGIVKSDRVDMATGGYDGVLFEVAMGAINATGVVVVKAAEAQTDIDGVALSAPIVTLSATHDNKLALIDVFRPAERFVQAWVERTIASSVVDAVIAHPYKLRREPAAQDASVAGRAFAQTPAEV